MEYKDLKLNGIYTSIGTQYTIIFRNKGWGIQTSFLNSVHKYFPHDKCCTMDGLLFRESTIAEINALLAAERNHMTVQNIHYSIY